MKSNGLAKGEKLSNQFSRKRGFIMAFDAEFLNGVFANEELTAEQRVDAIIAEHNASERGLINKRDELLGAEKKYKDKIAGYETEKGKFTAKISELEKTLEKNSSDKEASKEYWKAQFEGELKKRDEDNAKIASERDFFKKSHYERLQKDAIEEGIKDINFIDGLKNGFIATVMMQNHFEPTDIDGKVMFLNSEQKTIQEVVKNFATTTEGKAYIKNPSSGGGARGSSHTYQQGGTVMSRADFDNLNKTNPQAVKEFFAKGGKIID